MQFPMGPYSVVINFAGGGNVQTSAKVLAHMKAIALPQIFEWIKRHGTLSVADNVSKEAAEEILNQFKKLNMQGRIVVRPRKRR